MRRFLYDNSLSIALFGLFFAFLIGLSLVGQRNYNQHAVAAGKPQLSYSQYVRSGEFVEAVFENWESEFLQMWTLVVLTIFLRQKGSPDSKKLEGGEAMDTRSRYHIIREHTWRMRRRALRHMLYDSSLSWVLLSLFVVSFILHAWGGTSAYNDNAGVVQISVWQYMQTAQFWFQSLQNWQSEFLSVGALLVLAIFLRQRGSPQSKPIGEANRVTGRE